jgi:hypothetical protein
MILSEIYPPAAKLSDKHLMLDENCFHQKKADAYASAF